MKRFTGVLLAVTAGVLMLGATSAFGATRTVGACQQAGFSTIQAAVNASSANDKIIVCAGTYGEQVSIPAGKDGLSLQSNGHLAATIQAPPAMTSPKAIVRVTGSQNVKITDFLIQGPGDGGCGSLEYGVRVDGGGSATVSNNRIAHIRDNPFGGCQNGVAILAGRSQESTTGSVTAKSNVIDDYQKNGVTVSGAGSVGTITNNTITGAGPTAVIAQNGIQFSGGAAGTARGNTISGNKYSPQTTTSTGLLLFGPLGVVTVAQNTVSGSDVGVYVIGGNASTLVSGNTISSSTWDGVTLDSSTGSTVADNDITGGDQGIGVYATTTSTIRGNSSHDAVTNGIYAAADSSNNRFQNNYAGEVAPGGFDCRDDSTGPRTSGTNNTWQRNVGATSSPLGLCLPEVEETES